MGCCVAKVVSVLAYSKINRYLVRGWISFLMNSSLRDPPCILVHSHALWSPTKENHENPPKNTKKDDSKGNIRCKKISTEISEQNYFTSSNVISYQISIFKIWKISWNFLKSLFRAIVWLKTSASSCFFGKNVNG